MARGAGMARAIVWRSASDRVKRRPGSILRRSTRPADMHEPGDAFVLLKAERGKHAGVIRVPLGDPTRGVAERVRGEHEAHRGRPRGKHLFPFGNLYMR